MKRKWSEQIDGYYRCKICGIIRMKKRDLIFHTTKHTKWDKRSTTISRINYNYLFEKKLPNTKAIHLGGLF